MSEDEAMVRPVVAGNWKMNHGPVGAGRFLEGLDLGGVGDEVELILFPPALSVGVVREGIDRAGAQVGVGVQNIHAESAGAFTGELSAEMAVEAGADFALVGHSERRRIFGETPDDTARKVAAALRAEITPVLCVGETLKERRAGRLEEVLGRQLDTALSPTRVREPIAAGTRFLLAYEPVWAIGTGETATPDDAAEAHTFLRARLRSLVPGAADRIPILYGGSVKPDNVAELLQADQVNGVLVGGASLTPGSFVDIARRAMDGR